jgi:hypothetical protein
MKPARTRFSRRNLPLLLLQLLPMKMTIFSN